jgi:hypothetical protein
MNKKPEGYRINWLHHSDRMVGNSIPKVLNVGLLHEAEEMLEDLEFSREISGDSNENGNIQ